MSVLIIDYGLSNLGSIKRSLEECGGDCRISENPDDIDVADRIILPGVGAFADSMKRIHQRGWYSKILKAVLEDKLPILGICLGMQLLATRGFEGGETLGLDLIHGEVNLLEPNSPGIRIPHVGWNEVHKTVESSLLYDIPSRADFYFVHSYHFVPEDDAHIIANTPYCGNFVSAVMSKNVMGTQFHPEKSGRLGFKLLQNFLKC